jgi:hypothetical protein
VAGLKHQHACLDEPAGERFAQGRGARWAVHGDGPATIVTLSNGADARPAAAEIVSGTYFAVLGVRPFLGRVLTPDGDRVPGTSSVVVLSHDFWETQLGSAPDVIGRKVSVNRVL